ncbi:hypothetical protein V6N12_034538 [Hibiscus sabdariffa]|uniref:Uncharacterized protein n=1 Tax=Hibiscus sabdariffa TaxID=183260 RepID=A0ABR2DHF3_9ROSI
MHAFCDFPLTKEVLVISGSPDNVIDNTTTSTKEWLQHVAENLPTENFDRVIVLLWNRKSIAGRVMINVDGAYSPTYRHATVEFVARNNDGMVLTRLAKRLERSQNVGLTEAAAFH